ncbi:MAG: sigmaB regulation protein RsbU, partial [Bdellovibrionaceae bacterium]|nr:sigmaB regulation protein RsbU [Pseudobdellovibrionaceae bacterium]
MSDKKDELIQKLQDELNESRAELSIYKNRVKQLNVELEKIINNIGRDLQNTLKLQKLLSPTEIPKISGFEISSKF